MGTSKLLALNHNKNIDIKKTLCCILPLIGEPLFELWDLGLSGKLLFQINFNEKF
jgi:hypothetical protein